MTPSSEVVTPASEVGESAPATSSVSTDGASTASSTPSVESRHEADEQIWHIGQFEATPDDEVAAETAFYSELRNAWLGGDEVRAFDLLAAALADRPAHLELRILRAAVALSGVNAGTLPLRVLGGESGESARVPVATLLFVVAEFQRGIPGRPAAMVPWTGLYHPHLVSRLIGSYVSLWSHGLRPLLRNQALMAGDVVVFQDFDPESPSLVECVLTAQLLAVQGDVARARDVLKMRIEEQVAREYVSRWRALVRALDASLDALAVVPARDARSLLLTWEKQATELVPEASGTLLILPLVALERLERRRAGREPARAPSIPDATAIREVLVQVARARLGPRAGPRAFPEFRAEHAEMVSSFLMAARRLRDFRADSLVRIRSGDLGGILSDELVHFSGLRFVEDGRRRAEFNPGDGNFPVGETDASEGHGWVVPCGDGASVWVD